MTECNNGEFDVLGYKVRFKADNPEANPDEISASDIVNIVEQEANKIREAAPGLDNGKVAILVALKMAKEKMILEKEYRTNIDNLQRTAMDALQFIEEVTPTA